MFLQIILGIDAQAQIKVGENADAILPGSLLELESTNKAVTLPRLTTSQMGTMPSPVNGMFVFNTRDQCIFQYNNNTWSSLCAAGAAAEHLILRKQMLVKLVFTKDLGHSN